MSFSIDDIQTLLRPIIMVIVEIENGLYGIMYRPALVEKEAKISLATPNESE